MTAFIIVTGIVVVIWFVLSDKYGTQMQDPQMLSADQIEDLIVELKKKILVTSAYTAEKEYEYLYFRLSALMEQILERHKHFILNVEAKGKGLSTVGAFQRQYHDSLGMQHTENVIPHDLDLTQVDPDTLIYICFFLWFGGQVKNIGVIVPNPTLMLRILDYLISKDYPPALFFKGMIMKYGKTVYAECNPVQAKELLNRALQAGIGSATIELEQIDKYFPLIEIKSIHINT